jgi:ubiquinone/menaquinone biosynthesis C-methylase UbiE
MTEPATESPNAREAQYWNSAATRPWAEMHEPIDRLFSALTQTVLELAAPQPGERVIDIGCGSGTTVLELARRVGPSGYVLGADISQQSVEKAQSRIAAAGLSQAEVSICDVSVHPFATDSFDLAFSRFGVMFFTDPTATFTNLRRGMKRGGRLTFAVFRTPQENPWGTAPVAAVRHLLPPITPAGPDDPGQFSWADPARVRRILEGAGFEQISLMRHDPAMRLAGPGGAAEAADFAMTIGPIARAMSNASSPPPDAVRSGLEAFFRSHDSPQGIVLLGALWIVRARA